MKRLLSFVGCIATVLFTGPSASAFDRNAYTEMNDRALLSEVFVHLIVPTSRYVYADQEDEFASMGILLDDVVSFDSGCQLHRLADATRIDLEVIHYLWVRNKGRETRAAERLKKTVGEATYTASIKVYTDSTVDCQFETQRFISDSASE